MAQLAQSWQVVQQSRGSLQAEGTVHQASGAWRSCLPGCLGHGGWGAALDALLEVQDALPNSLAPPAEAGVQ